MSRPTNRFASAHSSRPRGLDDDGVSSLGGANSTRTPDDTDSLNTHHYRRRYLDDRHRLDIASLGLVGRQQELGELNSALERIAQPDGPSELCMVSGISGTGKSSLVNALRRPVTLQKNGFYVSGKFDQLRNDPFSAIVEAFSDLCDLVVQELTEDQRVQILDVLDKEYTILVKLLPNLRRLRSMSRSNSDEKDDEDDEEEERNEAGVGVPRNRNARTTDQRDNDDSPDNHNDAVDATVTPTTPSAPPPENTSLVADDDSDGDLVESAVAANNGKDVFARFKFACRRFMQAVSSVTAAQHPVLLFLDDLQWADEGSAEVIRSLLTDRDSRNVLYVCSYRSECIDELSVPMRSLIDGVANATGGDSFSTNSNSIDAESSIAKSSGMTSRLLPSTEIRLSNFDLEGLNTVLSHLLDLIPAKTNGLADLVLQRTHGNPYFVIQFLRYLESAKLLYFSRDSSIWAWNEEEILSRTSVSDNVVEVLRLRIEQLPECALSILQLAACIGFKFERAVLWTIHGEDTDDPNAFNDGLEIAQTMGLIETNSQRSNDLWSFSHDRVHRYMYDMIPDVNNERLVMHMKIARRLQTMQETTSSAVARDNMTYAIADQLNRAKTIFVGSDHIRAAQANLAAARVAVSKSAIPSAARYIHHGTTGIEGVRSAWSSHYRLALDLYTLAAQVHYCAGQFDASKASVDTVVLYAKTFEDGLVAQITLVNAYGTKGDVREAVLLAFQLSRKLGYKLPKKPNLFHVIFEFAKTKRVLKKMTDEDLLNQKSNKKDNLEIFY